MGNIHVLQTFHHACVSMEISRLVFRARSAVVSPGGRSGPRREKPAHKRGDEMQNELVRGPKRRS